MIGQILPFQLHKIFLSRLMWTWKGQDVYVIVEWPLSAKHRQMTRNYKMVDYTTHVVSPFIKTLKPHVWWCVRTVNYLGRSFGTSECLRVGGCLRALESSRPNFRSSFLGEFRGDDQCFWLNYSLQTSSKRKWSIIASRDGLCTAAVHSIQMSSLP